MLPVLQTSCVVCCEHAFSRTPHHVQADLVSVFEHLRGGRVREAQLSAAKYCHNHPGDPAEPALLAVLQM